MSSALQTASLWLGLLGPVFLASAAQAAEPAAALADFDEYIHAALTDWHVPGVAIAIVKDGDVLLARGYGTRHAGEANSPNEHTLFPISSVTKVFTVTCLALLVEEGKLNWNDPVVKHIPEFQLYDPFLTKDTRVDDLVSHRVGLESADLLAYRGDHDRTEILYRLRFLQPVAPFRSRFGYHNHMLSTAGEVLERASKQSWADFLRTRLLQPLRMKSTLVSPRELTGHNNVSTQHVLIGDQLVDDPVWKRDPANEAFLRLHDTVAPAGAIQSTAYDMANFLRMYVQEGQFDGSPVLKPETIRLMFAPHSPAPIRVSPQSIPAAPKIYYGGGLGWQIRDYRGRKIVMHSGSTGAIVALMPEEKIGLAVMANRGCSLEFMLMHDIFGRLLGLPRLMTNRDWLAEAKNKPALAVASRNERLESQREKNSHPSLPLARYAGSYDCDLYGRLEVSLKDGALHVQFGPNISGTCIHWEHDAFRSALSFPLGEEWLIRFDISAGEVTALHVERLSWPESMPEFRRLL